MSVLAWRILIYTVQGIHISDQQYCSVVFESMQYCHSKHAVLPQ